MINLKIKKLLKTSFDNILGIQDPIISNCSFEEFHVKKLDKIEVVQDFAKNQNLTFAKDFFETPNFKNSSNIDDLTDVVEKRLNFFNNNHWN